MVQCATLGTYGAFAIQDANTTFGATSKQFEYLEESMRAAEEIANTPGIRGTRSRFGARNRVVAKRAHGSITMEPNPAELEVLWKYILGAPTKSGSYWDVAEVLPKFGILVDKVARRAIYAGGIVSKATFSGQKKQPIKLTLDIEATSEAITANAFASYSIPAVPGGVPYIMADGTLTLWTNTFEFDSFTLTIDNVLDADRFMNSITRDCIPSTDRIVTLDVSVPYNSGNILDAYSQSVTGAAGSLAFAFGGNSCEFEFVSLYSPAETPGTKRGEEMLIPLKFEARATNSTKEIRVKTTLA